MKNIMDQFWALLGMHTNADDSCSGPLARPRHDWLVISVSAIMFFVLLSLCDAWVYFSVTESVSQDMPAGGGGPSQQDLQDVLSQYAARSDEYQTLLKTPVSIKDPSGGSVALPPAPSAPSVPQQSAANSQSFRSNVF